MNPSCACNLIELHVVRHAHVVRHTQDDDAPAVVDGSCGWAKTALARDDMIGMMRAALKSPELSGCKTATYRTQASFVRDLTMERVPRPPQKASNHPPAHADVRDRVFRTEVLGLVDLRRHAAPLVCTYLDRRPVPSSVFPCHMQCHELRHCMARKIVVGGGVTVFFEVHMNEAARSVHRAWIEARLNHRDDATFDRQGVCEHVRRALKGCGIVMNDAVLSSLFERSSQAKGFESI